MENKDTSSHNRKKPSFLDYINSHKDIPDEMRTRLKERIDRLGEETVRKAFLNARKKIAIDLKLIEDEKKSKEGKVNKDNTE